MPLREKLNELYHDAKGQVERYANERKGQQPPPNYQQQHPPQPPHQYAGQHQPQYSYERPPPPPPPQQHVMGASAPQVYWQPHFHPSVPVSQAFEHQKGAGGWGNNELQTYTESPANSFHTPESRLILRAIVNHTLPDPAQKFTSARLVSHQSLNRNQGFLSARLQPPVARGIWPAFWLLPREPFTWPHDGEVDIMETWNADPMNHSCLHWGFYTGEDSQKHKVIDTPIPDFASPWGHEFGFAWQQSEHGPGGRLVWYIDGRPVMRAAFPSGTKPLREFQIIINVAMGGNVCQGEEPADGVYDLVVHEIKFFEEPVGGWQDFERAWQTAPEGHGC